MSLDQDTDEKILRSFLIQGLHVFSQSFSGEKRFSRWRLEENIRKNLESEEMTEKITLLKKTIKKLQKDNPDLLDNFMRKDEAFMILIKEYLFSDKNYMLKLFLKEKK